jgi:hypothetical protein
MLQTKTSPIQSNPIRFDPIDCTQTRRDTPRRTSMISPLLRALADLRH